MPFEYYEKFQKQSGITFRANEERSIFDFDQNNIIIGN